MKDLKIYNDTEDLINALAEAISKVAKAAIETHGQFNFVLSGGNSPRKLYTKLASEPYKSQIDWKNTFFFFGDERFVPILDDRRNSKMAKEVLFDPLKIEDSHIFLVDTTGTPEESAANYIKNIETHFQNHPVEFDFILLGLGDNSHTASLFPHTYVLNETKPTVKAEYIDEVHMDRITMTAPLINQAKEVAFLVFGKDKAEAVYQILEGNDGTSAEHPARLIDLDNCNVTWFLDTEAASKL